MPDERFEADDPREWLNRARSNLAKARGTAPDVYLEDLCFDAQQAAEKAIKAVLIHLEVRFPFVHDLAQLLGLVERAGMVVSESLMRAVILSDYAVEARYPGIAEPVTEPEYEEVIVLAEQVVQWAQRAIERGAAAEG
jgi:HEPN domain-containing protein